MGIATISTIKSARSYGCKICIISGFVQQVVGILDGHELSENFHHNSYNDKIHYYGRYIKNPILVEKCVGSYLKKTSFNERDKIERKLMEEIILLDYEKNIGLWNYDHSDFMISCPLIYNGDSYGIFRIPASLIFALIGNLERYTVLKFVIKTVKKISNEIHNALDLHITCDDSDEQYDDGPGFVKTVATVALIEYLMDDDNY